MHSKSKKQSILIHHYVYVTITTHIGNNFWTLTNKWPNGFPIIGFGLSFVTLILFIFFFFFFVILELLLTLLVLNRKMANG